MLFIPVLFTAACLTSGLENACVGDECATKDDAVFVQKTRVPRKLERDLQKGLALEGGGFLAHAAHTGVLTALLNRIISPPTSPAPAPTPSPEGLAEAEEDGAGRYEPGAGLTELMKNVKIISSASGGSWWMAQLAYSRLFVDMVDAMANAPNAAGEMYREFWIDPFIDALMKTSTIPDSVLQDLKNIHSFKDLLKFGEDLGPLLIQIIGSMMRSETPRETETMSGNASHKPMNSDEIVGDSMGENALEVIVELAIVFLTAGGDDWQALNKLLLTSTTKDLDDSMTLGSPVNEWAKDKWWLIGAAISTPGGLGPGTCQAGAESQAVCLDSVVPLSWDLGLNTTFISQTTTGENTCMTWKYSAYSAPPSDSDAYKTPLWTPARFSAVLGGGARQWAPMDFCETGCEDLRLQYDAMGQTHVSDKVGYYDFLGFKTSLFGAVSASTAFMGWAADVSRKAVPSFAKMLTNLLKKTAWATIKGLPKKWQETFKCLEGQEIVFEKAQSLVESLIEVSVAHVLNAKMAVWFQTAVNGQEAFSEASETLNIIEHKPPESFLKVVADKKLMALVDGGLTDNTGIGNALAAGSREIICFAPMMDHVWRLMGGKDYKDFALPSDAPLLSELLPKEWIAAVDAMAGAVNTCPFCYANFQLFQETVEIAQKKWDATAKSFTVPTDVLSVKTIKYGSMDLTTKKNDYFGIRAGDSIGVRILNVEPSSANIGGFNYYDYATLVQDIVKVMQDPRNQDATGKVLKWFD